jgi:hypothetical protein
MYSETDIYLSKDLLKVWNALFGNNIKNKPRSTWYPQKKQKDHRSTIYVNSVKKLSHQYPLYIVSKNRYDKKMSLTANWLIENKISFNIIVEESQLKFYREQEHLKSEFCNILELPQNFIDEYKTHDEKGDKENMSKGSGSSRNFAWEHSIQKGYKKHWVMDDNIDGFTAKCFERRLQYKGHGFFRAIEDITTYYPNVKMSGPGYDYMAPEGDVRSPLNINTRIYSCNLIDNSLPMRWRGRYNEDTLLSLDIMDSGFDTLQVKFLLQNKTRTGTMRGGNADEIYKNGTKEKSEILVREYPEISKVVWRYNRDHHDVFYKKYKRKSEFVNRNIRFEVDAFKIGKDGKDDFKIDINEIP